MIEQYILDSVHLTLNPVVAFVVKAVFTQSHLAAAFSVCTSQQFCGFPSSNWNEKYCLTENMQCEEKHGSHPLL